MVEDPARATTPPGSSRRVAVEQKGIEPVLDGERHGTPLSAFTLWFAGNLQYSALAVGAIPTAFLGLSFAQAALALVIGTLIGSLLLGVAATMGPQAGAPQMVQSRGPFGYFGNFLPVALLFLTGFGYFAVNTVLGTYIVRELLGIPFLAALVVVALVQIVIAIIGHDFVHRVERALVVVMAVLFLIITGYGIARGDLGAGGDPGTNTLSGAMLMTVAICSSRTFGWAIGASDYTRYLPRGTSRRRLRWAAFGGAAIAGLWMHLLGAAIGTAISPDSPTDLVTQLIPNGLAVLALVALLASTVAGSVLDIYSGSLALLMADIPLRRWVSALLTGILGAALGWWAGHTEGAVFGNFQNFLFLVGYWIGPWLGVTLVDFLVHRRDDVDVDVFYDRTRRVGAGLPAFLIGVAVSIPFMHQSLFTGPVAAAVPQLGDITYWVGGAVAAAAYYFLTRRREVR
ncbi:nucleobase:cation symporter-1, NCS1 family [Saccharopolyspora kobensis]|uniref:Nucleobase:cation symporter-1, NCS1 family n=1 Tax=Saccharopolyspora kobensis TaxID=146035 RepID=A0A1H6A0W5_9PSEU|nr:cytosine permease [Saccharopolyspora kobensis]SEG41356.1 nucleobase:cation symporter-1, NCS1 family [Saccharopolyspora kobensis]SFE16240.1 nucleobase:cation symporter-1, NCS1 family [Saccharopolyspora kobensis]